MTRKRVAVLISGRGSNMQALIDAARAPDYPAEIVRVIANIPEAGGLTRAAGAGIATETIDHRKFPNRPAFETALDASIRASGADLVCLAGFMRLLTAGFVDAWRDRLINIHPSLLPKFPGLDTHARALQAGEPMAGCTVHFVRSEMDSGPMLVQYSVPVRPGDDEGRLAARVLKAEHVAYPRALQLVAAGNVEVRDEIAYIGGKPGPLRETLNPTDGN